MENRIKPKILFLLKFNSIKSKIFFKYLSKEYELLSKQYDVNIFISDTDLAKLDLNKYLLPEEKFYIYKSNHLSNSDDIIILEKFDFLITNGWTYKISNKAINAVKFYALNCHSSYLPDYKGGSVYYAQWANFEKYGGITCHIMTENFDEGNIICRKKFKINFLDTPKKILQKAAVSSGPIIFEAIDLIIDNYRGIPQKGGRYFFQLNKTQMIFYRIWNMLFSKIKNLKLTTPHKINEK